jgi:hypothetical protein
MHWVVETGRAIEELVSFFISGVMSRLAEVYTHNRVAMITVNALPSSIEKPREGDCNVILLPRFRMML